MSYYLMNRESNLKKGEDVQVRDKFQVLNFQQANDRNCLRILSGPEEVQRFVTDINE